MIAERMAERIIHWKTGFGTGTGSIAKLEIYSDAGMVTVFEDNSILACSKDLKVLRQSDDNYYTDAHALSAYINHNKPHNMYCVEINN